jgi:undecaprenyl-diphosphatase
VKLVPIAFALALAGATVWRWTRLGWALRTAAGALCGALALYGAGVFHLPQLETMVGTIGSTLGPYTYVLVGVMAFLETGAFVGLLVPGETVVIVGGVVAAQGHVDVVALVGLTWLCALGGDLSGYVLGRRLGRRFLLEHGPRVGVTEARLVRIEKFFARYGLATILIGRFVGLVRPVAPFLAGASRYPARRFVPLAIVGTGLWSAAFVVLGFLFWQSFDKAIAIAQRGSLLLGATVVVVIGVVLAHRYLRGRPRRPESRGPTRAGRGLAAVRAKRARRSASYERHPRSPRLRPRVPSQSSD